MDEAPIREPLVGGGRVCRGCGYSLEGLGGAGKCPECGGGFPPFWDDSRLSAGRICWRLGWPVAGLAACAALIFLGVFASGSVPMALGAFGAAAMTLCLLINTPIQIVSISRRHAKPGHKAGFLMAHLPLAGKAAVSLTLLATLSPIVLFAACLYVVTH